MRLVHSRLLCRLVNCVLHCFHAANTCGADIEQETDLPQNRCGLNWAPAAVAREVFPAGKSPRSLNYIGKSVESLALLLLQAGLCDMILSFAFLLGHEAGPTF